MSASSTSTECERQPARAADPRSGVEKVHFVSFACGISKGSSKESGRVLAGLRRDVSLSFALTSTEPACAPRPATVRPCHWLPVRHARPHVHSRASAPHRPHDAYHSARICHDHALPDPLATALCTWVGGRGHGGVDLHQRQPWVGWYRWAVHAVHI